MRAIVTVVATLLLVGCATASPTMTTQPLAMPAARTETRNVAPPPRGEPGIKREKMLGSGGTFTWKPVTFKVHRQPEEYVATLGYAPNSLGKGTFPMSLQDSRTSFLGTPVPSGVTLDWVGLFVAQARNLSVTFDSGNELLVITGSALDPGTSYSIFFYTADCLTGCYAWTLQSVTALGTPTNGELSMPSPLENGYFMSDANDAFTFDLVH